MASVIYSCAEHIDELLEFFLDESEEMPIMDELEEINGLCDEREKVASPQFTCDKCELSALYRLSGSEVKARWE